MALSASEFFGILLNIRTHAILMYFMAFLFVSKKVAGGLHYEYVETGLLYSLALQLSYVYNKINDMKEDLYNGESLKLNNFLSKKVNLFLLITALSAYVLWKHFFLLPVFAYCFISIIPYSRYKGIPGMKSISVTAGFFLMSVMTPCLLKDSSAYAYAGRILLSSLSMLTMVFSLTVIFDIRDAKGDGLAGLKTIPVVFGEMKTLIFLAGLMTFSLLADPLEELKPLNSLNYLLIISLAFAAVKTGRKFFYDAIIFLETALLGIFLWKM